MDAITIGAGYTYLDATFQSEETVNGESNSTNDRRRRRRAPGLEGTIEIEPGDRMPLIPRHMFKAYADVRVTPTLSLDLDLVAVSSSYARGNENNRHEPDGTYYLGPGPAPAMRSSISAPATGSRPGCRSLAQINNLFDRRYYTAAQLGPLGFTETGDFIARPFPRSNGEFPVRQATFYAPGAPIADVDRHAIQVLNDSIERNSRTGRPRRAAPC